MCRAIYPPCLVFIMCHVGVEGIFLYIDVPVDGCYNLFPFGANIPVRNGKPDVRGH